MAKFSDINKGPELAIALTNYRAWKVKSKADKKPLYKAVAKSPTERVNLPRQLVFISTFSSSNVKVLRIGKIIGANLGGAVGNDVGNMLRTAIANRYSTELATGDEPVPGRNYKFARVIASKRTVTATTDNDKSRLTGNLYARHRSNNVSTIFGRTTVPAEAFSEAVVDIRNDQPIIDFLKIKGNSIGFVAEGQY